MTSTLASAHAANAIVRGADPDGGMNGRSREIRNNRINRGRDPDGDALPISMPPEDGPFLFRSKGGDITQPPPPTPVMREGEDDVLAAAAKGDEGIASPQMRVVDLLKRNPPPPPPPPPVLSSPPFIPPSGIIMASKRVRKEEEASTNEKYRSASYSDYHLHQSTMLQHDRQLPNQHHESHYASESPNTANAIVNESDHQQELRESNSTQKMSNSYAVTQHHHDQQQKLDQSYSVETSSSPKSISENSTAASVSSMSYTHSTRSKSRGRMFQPDRIRRALTPSRRRRGKTPDSRKRDKTPSSSSRNRSRDKSQETTRSSRSRSRRAQTPKAAPSRRSRSRRRGKTPETTRGSRSRSKRGKTPEATRSRRSRRGKTPEILRNHRSFFTKIFQGKKITRDTSELDSIPGSATASTSPTTINHHQVDQGYFFAEDDMSALTAPTIAKSHSQYRARSGEERRIHVDTNALVSADPSGKYWDNLPPEQNSNENENNCGFDDTKTATSSSPKKVTKPSFDEFNGSTCSMQDPYPAAPLPATNTVIPSHVMQDPSVETPIHQNLSAYRLAASNGLVYTGSVPHFDEGYTANEEKKDNENVVYSIHHLQTALPSSRHPLIMAPQDYQFDRITEHRSMESENNTSIKVELPAVTQNAPGMQKSGMKKVTTFASRSIRSIIGGQRSSSRPTGKKKNELPTNDTIAYEDNRFQQRQWRKSTSAGDLQESSVRSLQDSKLQLQGRKSAGSFSFLDPPTTTDRSKQPVSQLAGKSLKRVANIKQMTVSSVETVALLRDAAIRNRWQQTAFGDDGVSPARRRAEVNSTGTPLKSTATIEGYGKDASGLYYTLGSKSSSSPKNEKIHRKATKVADLLKLGRDVSISKSSVTMGVTLLRKNREDAVASGRSKRVVLCKTVKIPVVTTYFDSERQMEHRDPIKRAGRRILNKGAIPIQAAARKFLAQREAVDRMWGLLEIQSYFRRWAAEASLLANKHSATVIQRCFRGARIRSILVHLNNAATQIQKIVRGYITSAQTYDTVHKIILVQAKARGNRDRQFLANLEQRAITIQSAFRGMNDRAVAELRLQAVYKLQAMWRSYTMTLRFTFDMIDIIIIQNVSRQWLARRKLTRLRADAHNKAATKVQAIWRGFQGYTDYVFLLVDVLHVQRVARRWLAKRKTNELRREKSALQIQSHWRRHRDEMAMVYEFVRIIQVQSMARGYLVRSRLNRNAAKIQAAWRGFWDYSQLIISRFEVTKLQALFRGELVRNEFKFKFGCCIMIQCAMRRYLAMKRAFELQVSKVHSEASIQALRETCAARNIQFWVEVVQDCKREQAAALVIERFFFMVKREIDTEVRRVEKKVQKKQKTKADERLLEKTWLKSVDNDTLNYTIDSLAISPSNAFSTSPRKSLDAMRKAKSILDNAKKKKKRNVRHRASSPPMGLVMSRHVHESPPSNTKRMIKIASIETNSTEESTDLSGTTSPALSPSNRKSPSRKLNMSESELQNDLSLEEAFLDAEVRHKSIEITSDRYFNSRLNYSSKRRSFFDDDIEPSPSRKNDVPKPTPTSRDEYKLDKPQSADARIKDNNEGIKGTGIEESTLGRFRVMSSYHPCSADYISGSEDELEKELEIEILGDEFSMI